MSEELENEKLESLSVEESLESLEESTSDPTDPREIEEQEKTMPQRILFRNVPIDIIQPEDLEPFIDQLLEIEKSHQIIFLSYDNYLKAKINSSFREALHKASLILPTSNRILKGVRFLKLTKQKISLYQEFSATIRIMGFLEQKERRVYLLGGKQKRLLHTEKNLRDSFPSLKIVGRYPGRIAQKNFDDVMTAIKKSSPHLLIASEGIKGEVWVDKHKKLFSSGLSLYNKDFMKIVTGKSKVRKNPFLIILQPWRSIPLFFSILWFYISLPFIKLFKKHH